MIRDRSHLAVRTKAPGWRWRWWMADDFTRYATVDQIHEFTMRAWGDDLRKAAAHAIALEPYHGGVSDCAPPVEKHLPSATTRQKPVKTSPPADRTPARAPEQRACIVCGRPVMESPRYRDLLCSARCRGTLYLAVQAPPPDPSRHVSPELLFLWFLKQIAVRVDLAEQLARKRHVPYRSL